MVDSDEELGAYIYRTSRTAQLLREGAEATELTTNNDNNNITRPKYICFVGANGYEEEDIYLHLH